ncbi:ABC transporter substrate-binding protein [Marinomonas atlantica]|uniref:ABC transporter substrate-binding protein n=1 Tax=Marinomonas atlantica TaxID=1806668 RepID=UPI00082DC075|nr:ABC transporter substrate-binding protein [Marinomonas atlantica]MCO4784553.1 ABC transporter substrate-binding protein [Marinomonas atlantica]
MSFSKAVSMAFMLSLLLCANASIKAEPTPTNTVNVSASFDFQNLELSRYGYVFTRMQVVETLLNIDHQGGLLPSLAIRWEILDEGKHWRLSLRDGVVFHNDKPMTSQTVVEVLKYAAENAGAWQNVPIKSIQSDGHQQVDIFLNSPYQPLGSILAHHSSGIIDLTSFDRENIDTQLIGTGPYASYEIDPPYRLVVKKFDDYWGKKAAIPYARYLTGLRTEARMLQARSGKSDIIFDLDPIIIGTLQRQPTLNIMRSELPRTVAIKLNAEHPYLKDIKTRQALSLAIDRQGIAIAILRTPQSASAQLLPPSMGDWYLAETSMQQDMAKASELLTQQGWTKNRDGWLEKNEVRFEIDMLTYPIRPELAEVATVIQDQWKQLGIKLNIEIKHYSAIPIAHSNGSLETALISRNYGIIADPLTVLLDDFSTLQGSDWGSMNWANTNVQTLLKSLVTELDPIVYKQKAQQIAQVIYNEKPVIPIAYYVQQTAVSKRLNGFRFDPYERSYYLNELTWAQ